MAKTEIIQARVTTETKQTVAKLRKFMPHASTADIVADALRVLLVVLECDELRAVAARRQLTFDEAVADFLARKEVEHVARAS